MKRGVPPVPDPNAVWLTREEAAGTLRRSVRTFDTLREEHYADFPKPRIVGGIPLFRQTELHAWVEQQPSGYTQRGGARAGSFRGARREQAETDGAVA